MKAFSDIIYCRTIANLLVIYGISLMVTAQNGQSAVGFAYAGSPVQKRADGSAAASGESEAPPDPNIALKGDCLVVCDADVVGLKPTTKGDTSTTDRPANDGRSANNADSRGAGQSRLWDKMPFSAPNLCGGLVGVGRRSRRVAFSAMRNNIMGITDSALNSRKTVTFDYILVNVGNAFDSESSTFVAPVSGVYSLSFQVYRLFNKESLTVVLTVNGIPIFSGFANGDSGNHETAHNSGLIHLSERDRVMVQVSSGNLDGGWKFSTFSGYLIFEDEDY